MKGLVISMKNNNLISSVGEKYVTSGMQPWQEHPRPQMKREKYYILNGEWKLNEDRVMVPFPPQSLLSQYNKKVSDTLIYEKVFDIPDFFDSERVLLHFGAVDQIARVWVNDVFVGEHEGGYLPFTFDITDAVLPSHNILKVEAIDMLSMDYPYGKQTKKPGGMWYTPVSGIWQSVWIENVPNVYIKEIAVTPDLNGISIELRSSSDEISGFNVNIDIDKLKKIEVHIEGNKGYIDMSNYNPKLWTPDIPHLYEMSVELGEDKIESYFALRTIEIRAVYDKNKGKEIPRVLLNGKPIFMHGVLDQGYFCDGIYLPALPCEYENDIRRMKELGINFLRKHIKVEPEAFYYSCDRLGMLVMQDMVNSGSYSFIRDTVIPTFVTKRKKDNKKDISGSRKLFFRQHTKDTIHHLYNHPCIIAYTIFNEGWGQFNSDEMYDYVKNLDNTRLIDSTSGWFWQDKNDFDSEHIYFKVIPLKVKDRPLFVSECGGYSLAVKEHIYVKDKSYGYGKCANSKILTEKISYMYENMILPYIGDGLCGCVYTQLSDVEEEINGLYTYDRKVCKVDKNVMQHIANKIKMSIEKVGE